MTRMNLRPIKSGFMGMKLEHQYIFKAPQLIKGALKIVKQGFSAPAVQENYLRSFL